MDDQQAREAGDTDPILTPLDFDTVEEFNEFFDTFNEEEISDS